MNRVTATFNPKVTGTLESLNFSQFLECQIVKNELKKFFETTTTVRHDEIFHMMSIPIVDHAYYNKPDIGINWSEYSYMIPQFFYEIGLCELSLRFNCSFDKDVSIMHFVTTDTRIYPFHRRFNKYELELGSFLHTYDVPLIKNVDKIVYGIEIRRTEDSKTNITLIKNTWVVDVAKCALAITLKKEVVLSDTIDSDQIKNFDFKYPVVKKMVQVVYERKDVLKKKFEKRTKIKF